MPIGDGGGGYVGEEICPRAEGEEDSGGRGEGEEESGGREGRLGPPAGPDSGECLRLEDTPECEWRDGDPPEESVADLKGWIALMEGRRMGRGPGEGDVVVASGSACRPDLGLPLLAGESEPGGMAGTPPSNETGRDALPPEPDWRDPEPLVARESEASGARKGEECALVFAGSTKRSARLGPGGERGRLARMGEPLSEVCWRAVSVGVNDSSSWERKREDRRDSRVSIWNSGESK